MLLDNGDDIAAGLLHSMAAQIRHGFALGAMDDTHPGELIRDAGRIFGGTASHDDDFCAKVLRLSLQRIETFINKRRADDGRDYDRYPGRVIIPILPRGPERRRPDTLIHPYGT